MNDNPERSIILRPETRIETVSTGAKRIVTEMVGDTLALARQESDRSAIVTRARFKIGAYEWCEPDYRQILAWAEALTLDPESVVQRLLDDRSIRAGVGRFPPWAGTRFEAGKLIALHWDLDHLPLEHFRWVDGVDIRFLSFSAHCFSNGNRPVKTLQLPFPNLRRLSCGNLGLRELDLTRVGKLEGLDCCRTHIAHLDLSCVPLLKELDCSETHVSELDLAHTPMLTYLECNGTNIAALDLSSIPNLGSLCCWETRVSELDLRSVPLLSYLNCQTTVVSKLDLWCVPRLSYLDCRNSPICALDLAAVPHLNFLWCSCTRITELDLAQVPQLTLLDCDSDMRLDLSDVPKLEFLHWECTTSESGGPVLSAVPNLKELCCNGWGGASITRLDLSTVPKLEKLHLQHNSKLVELDLSAVPNLTELTVSGSPIRDLDIQPLKKLKSLFYETKQSRLHQRFDQDFQR